VIETVKGAIAGSALGNTLMHEHIFVRSTEVIDNYPSEWGDTAARVNRAVGDLQELKAAGIDTLVDMTVVGLGRDIELIQAVAQQVDINVVVATGLYCFRDLPLQLRFRGPGLLFDVPEFLSDWFVSDIQDGIAGSGVKAAILKCATDEYGVTAGVRRVLEAISDAHRRTGVAISTHTHADSRVGIDQLGIFDANGVDLTRVIIGHSGDTTDIGYLLEILQSGATVGLDRFGYELALADEQRIGVLMALCEAGYDEQIVLSQDFSSYNAWQDYALLPDMAPRWSYTRVISDIVPELVRRGLSEATINSMLRETPRRLLEQAR